MTAAPLPAAPSPDAASTAAAPPRIFGLILAGGLGRRMGGVDKALLPLAGRPLLRHVIDRLAPQVDGLLLSANGPPERFAAFGLPVLPDTLPDHPGPLAGVLAGLDHLAAAAPNVAWMASVPADAPFIPEDLVRRLRDACSAAEAPLAHAASAGRAHPVIALWPVRLRHALRDYLAAGERRVGRFLADNGAVAVAWDCTRSDPFLNVNTPEELARSEWSISAST